MRQIWEKSTLGERISWIINTKLKVSQNEFGKRCGIESGPMSRLAKDERTGDDVRRSAPVLGKIARAGDVNLNWLMSGQGQPDKFQSGEMSAVAVRYPSKLAAAEASAGVASPQAIQAMLTEEFADMPQDANGNPIDPGPEFFIKRVAFWQRQRQALEASLGSETSDLDDEPSLEGRPKKGRKR